MQLNNRSQAETPTPSDQSPPTAPVAYQIFTLSTQPIPSSIPDPGLTSELFFATSETGNTCIVCSRCDITIDKWPSPVRGHDASGKSSTNPTHYAGKLVDDLDSTLLGIEHGLDYGRYRLGFVEEDVGSEDATAEPAAYEFEIAR